MGTGLYTPGPVGPIISDETVALVRQAMADTTRAITMASGLIGYELEAPAKGTQCGDLAVKLWHLLDNQLIY